MYEKMTGNDLLTYLANLQRNVDWGFVEELSTRLDCNLSQSIRSLSRGNKQKVGLVQAFMHKPELIIMDEPTSGLDTAGVLPHGRRGQDRRSHGIPLIP